LVGNTTIKEGSAQSSKRHRGSAKLNKQDADVLDDWSKDRSRRWCCNSRLSNVE
jgi:hypothetical protein